MGNTGTCSNCGRPIRRNGKGGDWWHSRTASGSCYPGSGSWKKASPVEVEAR